MGAIGIVSDSNELIKRNVTEIVANFLVRQLVLVLYRGCVLPVCKRMSSRKAQPVTYRVFLNVVRPTSVARS